MPEEINPNRYVPLHPIDKQIENLPLEQRFDKAEIQNLIELLDQGYEIAELNEFKTDGKYHTTVKLEGDEKIISTAYRLPVNVTQQKNTTKGQQASAQLKELLGKIS